MSLTVTLSNAPCHACGLVKDGYDANITHNLTSMANEAGIYEILWRPEENNITKASQLIAPLSDAIKLMKKDPERFKKHNSSNGWGSYKNFLPWLIEYLAACEKMPNAKVFANR